MGSQQKKYFHLYVFVAQPSTIYINPFLRINIFDGCASYPIRLKSRTEY